MICLILGVFRNTLTSNDKYPVRDYVNLLSPIQMQLSLKPTTFSDCFVHFWNLDQILNILKKKMIVIATLLRKLQTLKDLDRPLSKNYRFGTPVESQHVKGPQTYIKSGIRAFP